MQSYLGSVVIDDVLSWLSGGVFEPDDVPEHEPGTCGLDLQDRGLEGLGSLRIQNGSLSHWESG
jgi:hypothetical protein